MNRAEFLAGVAALAITASCGRSKFQSYDGPEVTRIIVFKEQRRMYLMHGQRSLRGYDIDLGFEPIGHKQFEGDGKTPEGEYFIDRRNPDSAFHLSIGISYPNEADIAYAEEHDMEPGGDIFIHGARRRQDRPGDDWTWGCISVSNKEMEEIYSMVRNGTPIAIYP